MLNCVKSFLGRIYLQYYNVIHKQSEHTAGTVGYTEYTLLRGKTPPANVLDMTLNNLMVSSSNAGFLGNTE